jgi:hypothetical protein
MLDVRERSIVMHVLEWNVTVTDSVASGGSPNGTERGVAEQMSVLVEVHAGSLKKQNRRGSFGK